MKSVAEADSRIRGWRSALGEHLAHSLPLALLLAAGAMGIGFWLKWRYLLQPDPVGWYLHSYGRLAYTDLVALYLQQNLDAHPLPYLQTRLEYPVVVGAVQYLASFAPSAYGYFLVSGVMLGLAGLAGVWAIHRADPRSPLWVFAATPPLLLYAALNWDLLALLFLLLSLVLFQRRVDGWGTLCLSLGIWTKMFPIVFLLWIMLQRASEGNWRGLARIAAVVVVVSVAINLPVYLASPSGWHYFFDFQSARPPDGGSLWAHAPGWPVETVNRVVLVVCGTGVVALSLLGARARWSVAEYGLGALALLILASKVTSPQYDLWLMPFMALAPAPLWLVGAFVATDLAYFWSSFGTLYVKFGGQGELAHLSTATAGITTGLHQVALVVVLLWVLRRRLGMQA